jgi:D-arabinose 1-dehydrogenase-like Zn-dependent alcohol dehydrogenase
MRVRADFAHQLPEGLDSAAAAPLLCAGATVYAPLRRFGAAPGQRVGVLGLGGLGHLAVQFAAAMGATVTVLSTTAAKREQALELGAQDFALIGSPEHKALRGRLDLLLATVHADLDWKRVVTLLAPGGALVLLGMPSKPLEIPASSLVGSQRLVAGSLTANRASVQEMLVFAAEHGVGARPVTMPMAQAQRAIELLRSGKARYRIVLTAEG